MMIILDIDMPERCGECRLRASDDFCDDFCIVNGEWSDNGRPDDCPIVAQVEQEPCVNKSTKSTISQGFSQGPCEDCISRQAVLDTLKEWNGERGYNWTSLYFRVNDLPSVTPTHKKGKWIEEPSIGCKCSECGRKPYPYQADSSGDDYWKPDYCPNCGVEMESEDEE